MDFLLLLLTSICCCINTAAYSLVNCTVPSPPRGKILCYSMGFSSVPAHLPESTNNLDLSFNSISRIGPREFANLKQLRFLNMSDNKIHLVEPDAFRHLATLEVLNLSKNKITNVPRSFLLGLSNLTLLRLDGNQITDIHQSAFHSLDNLKTVNLSNNILHHPEKLKPLFLAPNLEELSIGRNNFLSFHSRGLSATPSSLKWLDLSWNPLRFFQLTDDIFPHLEYLDLTSCGSNGSLEWIVQDAAFLRSVRTLNLSAIHTSEEGMESILLSFNASFTKLRLRNIPADNVTRFLDVACSPALSALHLTSVHIANTPSDMFQPCAFLENLDLSEDKMSDMSPLTFRGLQQLQKLRLNINALTKVNIKHELPALEILDLSTNRIENLLCADFAYMENLKHLYLYKNNIKSIKPCVFENLKDLQVLKLGSNKILTVKHTFTNGQNSLQYLELMYNNLAKLDSGDFQALKSLTYLNLDDNKINVIEPGAFTGLANLTLLSIGGNKIKSETIRNPASFSGMPALNELLLHSNYLSYSSNSKLRSPPFALLTSLAKLSLNSQRRGLKHFPSNLLEGLTELRMLYAGSLSINSLPPDTFTSNTNLWFLDLTRNSLSSNDSLPPGVFQPLSNLTKLIVSRAQLQTLNFLMNANLSRLTTLRAQGNQLQGINQTLIDSLPSLQNLDLTNNTFACDCSNAWFLHWAETDNLTQVIYLNRFTCSYPATLRGLPLIDLNTESCTVNLDFTFFILSANLVILNLLVPFAYRFLQQHMVYVYYLFLAFIYDKTRKLRRQKTAFQYDAFISYNSQEELWVLRELLPKLEEEQGWKLCLHHRDFQPGKPIIDNIVEGIYNSRKTICLITQNYLKSEWCSKEIQLASFRLFDDKNDVLILVFLEDIPKYQLSPYHRMRKLVKRRTYLTWPRPTKDTKVFWQKLKMAMESNEEESPIISLRNSNLYDHNKPNS
ncbi:toll-like receptor 22 [Denticeps clupeoides]|uniref:TIR domain-containing protein n=1 Tax=Denticeps clupeoides TaxID=299321 RepID=A0AAY4EUN5_9TELE|nr:toll-like receptor 13 [Denticeps clupeoides]XP_028853734.1 toll-like receptor 13 [Denticeps clupeoides]